MDIKPYPKRKRIEIQIHYYLPYIEAILLIIILIVLLTR